MPIWITESDEKHVVDLIAELNIVDENSAASSHPVRTCVCVLEC